MNAFERSESDSFFVRIRGKTLGPYGCAVMQQMANRNQITKNTDVSCDGVNWNKAADFPVLFEGSKAKSTVKSNTSLSGGGSVGKSTATATSDSSESDTTAMARATARAQKGLDPYTSASGKPDPKAMQSLTSAQNAQVQAIRQAACSASIAACSASLIGVTKFVVGSSTPHGWSAHPDSAGGVDVKIHFRNNSATKTIKYVWFQLTPYNAVGDAVASQYSHQTGRCEEVGPISPGDLSNQAGGWPTDNYWQGVWYNHSIVSARIDNAKIEYMDGSIEILNQVPVPIEVKGCFVATSIYESYDCPSVWVLRRFRDQWLSKTVLGRKFISAYYTASPRLIDLVGSTRVFKSVFKPLLDTLVKALARRGYSDSPYNDQELTDESL